jgi:hypothetical protein
MVNSTPEFMEILHGVNQMFNQLEASEENRSLQQACEIDIIPLPHSESKFIVSFMVPCELLGGHGHSKFHKIDFADFHSTGSKPQIIRKPPKMLFCYEVDSLFDLNLALYDFQATLAPAVPAAQWSRTRRSVEVLAKPRENSDDKLKFVIIAEVTPAIEV